ncbi:MAG: HlyD family efflux transporter periplasmic adaptor subunit [Planctomycetales bacterium]|nr:HlyD family efflux transporter periplasmic adaptor subunit [Planctomycetales bacterium]
MTRYLLPLLAALLLALAVFFVVRSRPQATTAQPPLSPPRSPYTTTVAGAGLVESSSENISAGSPTTGVVVEVFVVAGNAVKAGDPLFRLDDRPLQAELKVREAMQHVAEAELARLKLLPREEQVPLLEATVQEQQANVTEAYDNFRRVEPLLKNQAVSEGEFIEAQQQLRAAEAKLAHARADLALLKAGAWAPDVAASQAEVDRAEADVEKIRTDIDQLTVKAPIDAHILKVNTHPGEFVTAFGSPSLVILGETDELHVRVDIDENDIPRFQEGAPAVAMPKGRSDTRIPLKFVRVEPLVIPKQSLTGEQTERVDTRVLQVIYEVGKTDEKLYVGQQLDVFIDAK